MIKIKLSSVKKGLLFVEINKLIFDINKNFNPQIKTHLQILIREKLNSKAKDFENDIQENNKNERKDLFSLIELNQIVNDLKTFLSFDKKWQDDSANKIFNFEFQPHKYYNELQRFHIFYLFYCILEKQKSQENPMLKTIVEDIFQDIFITYFKNIKEQEIILFKNKLYSILSIIYAIYCEQLFKTKIKKETVLLKTDLDLLIDFYNLFDIVPLNIKELQSLENCKTIFKGLFKSDNNIIFNYFLIE